MFLPLLLFLLAIPSYALSPPHPFSPQERTLLRELKTLEKTPPEEYPTTADIYRDKMTKYINNKKRVCNGEFSTIVFMEENAKKKVSPPLERKKLTPKQKKSCFRELDSMRKTFIYYMFIARKNYLVFIQDRQLKELEKVKQSFLKGL